MECLRDRKEPILKNTAFLDNEKLTNYLFIVPISLETFPISFTVVIYLSGEGYPDTAS